MAELDLDLDKIYILIAKLQRRIRRLESKDELREAEEENVGFGSEALGGGNFDNFNVYHVIKVTTIDETNRVIVGTIQKPNTGTATPFIDDDRFTGVVSVVVPDNVELPEVDTLHRVDFGGTVTNAGVTEPKYGLFSAGGGAGALQGTVTAVSTDTLTVENVSGDSVEVARPYLLRVTPFDGTTVNTISYVYNNNEERVATSTISPGISQTQVIIPDYVPSQSIIYYTRTNTTNITSVVFVDLNVDGRAWAKKA